VPVQRGKRHKKPRRRGGQTLLRDDPMIAARPAVEAAPPKRKGFGARQRPWWLNVAFGVIMLIVGVATYVIPQKGVDPHERFLFLLLYFVIAAVTIGIGIFQYRRQHQA
jgi:hypothetical protein